MLISSILKNISFMSYNKKYVPLIISGCSGAGKSTLINHLTNQFSEIFEFNPSHTTRKPRDGEIHGRDYLFLDMEEFMDRARKGEYIEYFNVHGNMYGTHEVTTSKIISLGKVCVLDMDIQGGQQIHKHYPNWNFLFIKCQNPSILKARLSQRGTDSIETIEKRMKNAEKELRQVQILKFYECIINDEIEEAKKGILRYVDDKYGLRLGDGTGKSKYLC